MPRNATTLRSYGGGGCRGVTLGSNGAPPATTQPDLIPTCLYCGVAYRHHAMPGADMAGGREDEDEDLPRRNNAR